MDQFHHVSKAFLELGKKLVLIFAHLSVTYFDIPWYMWFMTCCLFPKIYPLLFSTTLGEVGVSWVECKNLDIKRAVVCCGCDNQIHASFTILCLYFMLWALHSWLFIIISCFHVILYWLLYYIFFSSDAIELWIPI